MRAQVLGARAPEWATYADVFASGLPVELNPPVRPSITRIPVRDSLSNVPWSPLRLESSPLSFGASAGFWIGDVLGPCQTISVSILWGRLALGFQFA